MARSQYELVVIDAPSLAEASDTLTLLEHVDAVAVVARVGRSRRETQQRLRRLLSAAGAPVLGVVANGVRGRATDLAETWAASGPETGWPPSAPETAAPEPLTTATTA